MSQTRNRPTSFSFGSMANAREMYDWRMVNGVRTLVVVGLGFTVAAEEGEEYVAFRHRMLRYAENLTASQYPVMGLTLYRREEPGKRPYAQFECATPQTSLPRPGVSRQ